MLADLGQRDVDYIRRRRRGSSGAWRSAGRGLLMAGFLPPACFGGVAALSLSKILDNMEIGHNVMHGQYDWMGDPAPRLGRLRLGHRLLGRAVAPLPQLPAPHLHQHPGQGPRRRLRHPAHDRRAALAARPTWPTRWPRSCSPTLFQWGVALHDVEIDRMLQPARSAPRPRPRAELEQMWAKARTQVLKDYVLFPALAGPMAPVVLAGNATANLVRNLWSFAIIFCGHFPDGVATFSEEEAADESRGGWYLRQMLGSANITGGPLFHLLTGNLSHQIEHHLFPDLPAHRYAEIAPQVQALCEELRPARTTPAASPTSWAPWPAASPPSPSRAGRTTAWPPGSAPWSTASTPSPADPVPLGPGYGSGPFRACSAPRTEPEVGPRRRDDR